MQNGSIGHAAFFDGSVASYAGTPDAVAAALVPKLFTPALCARGGKNKKTKALGKQHKNKRRPAGAVDYQTLRECVYSVRSMCIVRAGQVCGTDGGLPTSESQWDAIVHDLRCVVLSIFKHAVGLSAATNI